MPSGASVSDDATLARIRSLAIPPAWTDVWICPIANGHLQATGRDARGRKQYRYHARFRAGRDAGKFDRIVELGRRLPRIRRRVNRDLSSPGLPRKKVIAAIVRLLELTLLRVGNDEYARLNRSFGLSTLRSRHARVRGETVRLRFRGKGGRMLESGVTDRRLAAVIRRCQELPGQQLFQYVGEDGETHDVDSDAVNEYIRAAAGHESISAKDFRTWAATVLAFRALTARAADPEARSDGGVAAVRETAERLGNTPAVARQSYVHPAVLEAFVGEPSAGPTQSMRQSPGRSRGRTGAPPTPAEERAVLALLRAQARRAKADAARGTTPDARKPMIRPRRRRV
jgi:DNA topoisomerase-1